MHSKLLIPQLDMTIYEPRRVIITPNAIANQVFTTYLLSCQVKYRGMIYAATLQNYFTILAQLIKEKLDVKVIFDQSQEKLPGSSEPALIKQLEAAGAVAGQHFIIATSQQAHQIMHMKLSVVDDLHVEDGSWNYTNSASMQNNIMSFTDSRALAQFYDSYFDYLWQWALANEPQTKV